MRRCPAPLVALALLPMLGLHGPSQEYEEEPSTLRTQMEVVENHVGRLRRDLRDTANNESSLELVVEIQEAALACKGEVPPRTAALPEGERAAFVAAYRLELVELLRGLLDIEAALLAGDNDAAQEALGTVRAMEEPAHERFMDDED